MKPKVTVLMPVFNGEKYLKEAIDSILNQSFGDFELLLINDGSTDNTLNIINSYQDCRLKVITNEINKGLIFCLNLGLDLAQGVYIVRMDSDDISRLERLKIQVAFMDKHQNIGVCGSYIQLFGSKSYVNRYYTKSEEIKADFLFNTCLAHPSVIIRKEVLDKAQLRFDPDFIHAEDFDFWTRLMDYTRFANIPQVLLDYRTHDASISQKYAAIQQKNSDRAKLRQLVKLGLEPSNHELYLHRSWRPEPGQNAATFLREEETWLNRILQGNQKNQVYDLPALKKVIINRWLRLCNANSLLGPKALSVFFNSSLRGRFFDLDKWLLIKFILRCLSKAL